LTTALVITLVGMGLVFGAILLFWLFMSVLVRFAGRRDEAPGVAETGRGESAALDEEALRERAALAAVSVALALDAEAGPKPFPLPPTALVSTWQAVMRSKQLGERGQVR
jgi:Na+-transporting methylmalonyl-CoA/oxaloacetate decarboxylase gamma subunit